MLSVIYITHEHKKKIYMYSVLWIIDFFLKMHLKPCILEYFLKIC